LGLQERGLGRLRTSSLLRGPVLCRHPELALGLVCHSRVVTFAHGSRLLFLVPCLGVGDELRILLTVGAHLSQEPSGGNQNGCHESRGSE